MDRAHETPTVEALEFTPHGAEDIEEPHPRRTSYHDERDYERRRDSHYDARERDGRDRERDHQSSSGSSHHHHRERNDRDRGDRDRERERDGGRDRERDRTQPDLYPPPGGQALGSGGSGSVPVFPGGASSGSNHHGHHDDRIEFERGDGARHGNSEFNTSSGNNANQDIPDQPRRRSLSRERTSTIAGGGGAAHFGEDRGRDRDYRPSRDADRDYRTSRDERYERGAASRRSRSRSRSPFPPSSSHSYRDRRVYVGNLAYDVDWTRLKDFMREVGPVAHADVLLGADGRSKGCGVVEFERSEDAKSAIRRMNDVMLNGRPIFVREDRESELRIGISSARISARTSERRDHPRGNEPITGQYRQIFVANLPFAIDWKALKDMFRGAGPVERADVFTTRDGRSKGIGTVLYETAKDVPHAVRMFDGYDWMGRRLEVREVGIGFHLIFKLNDFTGMAAGRCGSCRWSLDDEWRMQFMELELNDTFGPPAERTSSSYRDADYTRDRSRYEYNFNDRSEYPEERRPHAPAAETSSSFRDNARGDYRRSGNVRHDIDETMADVPSGPAAGSGDQIYVRNLPFTTTEQDLKDLFRTCGSMKKTEILLDDRGRPRGSGTVRFEQFESADKAVSKFDGYLYGGRSLEVMYDRV
ncbi:hypothetical protein DFQ27_001906 [Actinomortierella ambigua]|uniref:RRM domain-containing protein n=1 Tax=Actinomortierella ambigua TaxID=1343610 RepID=A0A9P6Q8U1_9FUNG|nr:hypothetical protein DFQ27_001906 [Actinomortierella ambigua]